MSKSVLRNCCPQRSSDRYHRDGVAGSCM